MPEESLTAAQRSLVDALTTVAHRVSSDELLAGRARGNYETLCGARVLAASLTTPERGQCQPCREQAGPTVPGGGR